MNPEFIKFVSKAAYDAVCGVGTAFLIFLGKKFYKWIPSVVHLFRSRQVSSTTFLNTYVDLEEYLGDFLEKYREIAKEAPVLSNRGFLRIMLWDICSLLLGLVRISVFRFLEENKAFTFTRIMRDNRRTK
jgi:hypothetical protein